MLHLGLSMSPAAPIKHQFDQVRSFLLSEPNVMEEEEPQQQDHSDFKSFYDAAIVVHRLTEAVVTLQDQPVQGLKSCLKQIISGSLTQDFQPKQSKDFFYELETAHRLVKAGFTVALCEPDIVVSGNGLSSEHGLACKYPSSRKQIQDHISKGYKQIKRQRLPGLVVIGLDQVLINEVFEEPPKFLDFRKTDMSPIDVVNEVIIDAVKKIVVDRQRDYPSEQPLDGALMTFSLFGIYGRPAGITSNTGWALQSDSDNASIADIYRIVEATREVGDTI